jgi:uncharacterized protein DUF2019
VLSAALSPYGRNCGDGLHIWRYRLCFCPSHRFGLAGKEDLRTRDGDQRRALLRLYDHPNAQVRLKAAKTTLAVAPEAARRTLQAIVDSLEYPQEGAAGMMLDDIDAGSFVPK